ncbi:MAG TPA: hypothetical protein V6C82_10120 [Chroococcales cyanobacterium]
MDANNFNTLGECDFGTVWHVEGEGKIVVNAFNAAFYFSPEEFAQFARMIGEANQKLGGKHRPEPPASKIRQFRPNPKD